MPQRKGLGAGMGKGYKNIIIKDPLVHSMSSKGIKQKDNEPLQVNRGFFSKLKAGGIPTDFGRIPTEQKKGLIKEIARKALEGVHWAIEWERQHLPAQKKWVHKEYAQAKDLARRGLDKVKDKIEARKHDMDDVRDELDIDNDGTQDISMAELESVNTEITADLEKIDVDKSGVPDYKEDGSLMLEAEAQAEPELVEHIQILEPPKPSLGRRIGTGLVSAEKFAERKFKSFQDKRAETRKELGKMTDAELKEMGIRSVTNTFGGPNKYEKEYLRRIKERKKLQERIIRQESREKRGDLGITDILFPKKKK